MRGSDTRRRIEFEGRRASDIVADLDKKLDLLVRSKGGGDRK